MRYWLQKKTARWLAGRGWEVREIVRSEGGIPLASVRVWPEAQPISAADIEYERRVRLVSS